MPSGDKVERRRDRTVRHTVIAELDDTEGNRLEGPETSGDPQATSRDRLAFFMERVRGIDWWAELCLAAKAAIATLLAASGYGFTWTEVTAAPGVSRLDLVLAFGCVLSGVALFTVAMRLARARDPWLGGLYVTALTVLMGTWSILFRGVGNVTAGTWMGTAACVAIIYVMDRGNPRKYPSRSDTV